MFSKGVTVVLRDCGLEFAKLASVTKGYGAREIRVGFAEQNSG